MGKKLAAEDHHEHRSENNPTLVDHSVDELAKGLATGTISRGRALRMLGAALVGGAFASIPAAAWAVCKQPFRKCTANSQCCSRRCIRNPQGRGRICGCPTGQTLCPGGNQCVTCNNTGEVVDLTTCQCECPPDTVLCNNACVSNVCDSTTGEVFNPASCKCECPVDTELCGGQCLAVCTPPKTQRNPQSCACECPTGTQTCGNTCCAEGELCQNGQCVVSGVCNNPFDPVACVFTTACIGCDVGGVCSLCASNFSSCTTSAEGTTVCVFGGSCSRTCTSTSECGPGEVCAVSCCNGGQDMVCFSACDNPTAREITLQTESQEPGGPGAAGRGAGGQRALPRS